jgi:hypothetical protein
MGVKTFQACGDAVMHGLAWLQNNQPKTVLF